MEGHSHDDTCYRAFDPMYDFDTSAGLGIQSDLGAILGDPGPAGSY